MLICRSVFCIILSVLIDEVDEIEVYGSEAQSGTQLATYSFEVVTQNHLLLNYKHILSKLVECVSYVLWC